MNEKKELGIALASCSGWNWLPGMLLISVEGIADRVVKVRRSDGWLYLASDNCEDGIDWRNPEGSYPDIYDPATLGCLISLLKFRMKEPTLHMTPDRDGWYISKLSLDGPEWYCGNGCWGLEDCYSPMLFSSQQEAIALTFLSLYENEMLVN